MKVILTTEKIPDNNNIRNLEKTSEIIPNNIIQYETTNQKNKINTRLSNKSSPSTSKSIQIKIVHGNTKINYCNKKKDENEIKSIFRPAPKKSGTTVHIRRTLPGNNTFIGGLAPSEGRTQKLKTIGHKQILEPTDDPT